MRPRFHPGADAEIDDAANHYFNISVALAVRLTDAIESCIAAIESSPKMFPRTDPPVSAREIRSLSLDDFPYSMIYEITRGETVVLAVAHHSRRPGYWLRRKA